MTEEVVYNVEIEDKECEIRCNWCLGSFTFKEKKNQYIEATNCPWCMKKLQIPRQKLRRSMRQNR